MAQFLALIRKGEEVRICKRNVPIARVVPDGAGSIENKTQLGCGRGSARVTGDLTEPGIPLSDWDMLKEGE